MFCRKVDCLTGEIVEWEEPDPEPIVEVETVVDTVAIAEALSKLPSDTLNDLKKVLGI